MYVHAKSLQLCLTPCDLMDRSPPGYSVHGILQARILKWVAIPPPRDLPHPGIKPASLMSPALAGRFFTLSITWEALSSYACVSISHSVVSNIPTTIYKIKGFPGGASGKDPACQWMGHGPWGCKESNTTEQLSLHFTLALSFLHSCFLFLFFLNSKHLPLFDKS